MEHANPYLIGLTGNIACGKSTVLAMLSARGARTIDADRITHRVQQPGTHVYKQIVAAFGPAILTRAGGPIDRQKLGELVFGDSAALQQLERIVHPAVRAELQAWLTSVAQDPVYGTREQPLNRPVAVIDAIKLLEGGWKEHCDTIWVVTCTEEQQIDRLIQTRGMGEAEARQRISAQPPQAKKVAQATVVIDNSKTVEHTQKQVEEAWAQVLNQIGQR